MGDVLVALEVLCNIDSIAVVLVFWRFLDSWAKFILLGTKKGFRFSGLMLIDWRIWDVRRFFVRRLSDASFYPGIPIDVRGESGKKSEVSSSDLEKKITKYHDNCCYYVNHCNLVNTKNLRLCHSKHFISTFALTIRMISLLPTCNIMLSKPNKMALWCSLSSNQCAIGPTAN